LFLTLRSFRFPGGLFIRPIPEHFRLLYLKTPLIYKKCVQTVAADRQEPQRRHINLKNGWAEARKLVFVKTPPLKRGVTKTLAVHPFALQEPEKPQFSSSILTIVSLNFLSRTIPFLWGI
jgi:hypothetical protein